jgi:DNA-binding NarL/FixJ family response regulator
MRLDGMVDPAEEPALTAPPRPLGIPADAKPPLGTTRTRILIADDHEVVRAGLKSILEAQDRWEVVAEAADGREAVAKALATKPDVAIIDYSLPVMNGLETTRQIRLRAPQTEVLALTLHENDELVGDLLHAGARAFVLKSDGTSQIIAAVQSLAAHRPFFTGHVSAKLIDAFLANANQRSQKTLSPRERVIVQLIAEGHSNKDMSRILNISQKTIESHRAAAMRKLGAGSTAWLVRYAIRHKLVEA